MQRVLFHYLEKLYEASIKENNDKVIEVIRFSQVQGFFRPDPELRIGVCMNFKGFAQSLVRLFNLGNVGSTNCEELWIQAKSPAI